MPGNCALRSSLRGRGTDALRLELLMGLHEDRCFADSRQPQYIRLALLNFGQDVAFATRVAGP